MIAQGCFTGGCLFPPGAGQTRTSPSLAMALGTEITHLRRGSEKLPIGKTVPNLLSSLKTNS